MRKLMISALTVVSISLGACTTTQVTNFLGQVQQAAAIACQFVPTIDTVLAVAGSLGFAPATAAAGAINAVTAAICSQVPKPASARYKLLARQGIGPASNVGNVGGIPINGWRTN